MLLRCGDIESNPGPPSPPPVSDVEGDSDAALADNSFLSAPPRRSKIDKLTEMFREVSQTMSRLEAGQAEQTSRMDQRLSAMEDKIDARLQDIRGSQAALAGDVDSLQKTCGELRSENEWLLLGIPHVSIERAHRVGTAIIAKFRSFKDRELVLSKCNLLKNKPVSVSEDVSALVRSKQKGLVPLKRELRKKGKKANIRFDKLHTDDGVYTFDLKNQQVLKLDRSSRPNPSTRNMLPNSNPASSPANRQSQRADDTTADSDPNQTPVKKLFSQIVSDGLLEEGGPVKGAGAGSSTVRRDSGASGGAKFKYGKQGGKNTTRRQGKHDTQQSKITEHVSRADMLSQPRPHVTRGQCRSQSAKRQRVLSSSPAAMPEVMDSGADSV
ncbi:hypothetical protein BaRGS_00023258 [Batillaria attramentaria]|uniref:Uncharacterized protein n=1 Tax=Batillaria attramentaria TaxID=370345 RepID=A0ABD0KEB9_9CAEN